MSKEEKIILILSIIIIVLLVINVVKFFGKNKVFLKGLQNKKNDYEAIVIGKRHYTDNGRNLYYVSFAFLENEREFIVNKYIYNELSINQKGILTIKYDYFLDFK